LVRLLFRCCFSATLEHRVKICMAL
jgi:hypothetical protein